MPFFLTEGIFETGAYVLSPKKIAVKNGVKNIQAMAYNGEHRNKKKTGRTIIN